MIENKNDGTFFVSHTEIDESTYLEAVSGLDVPFRNKKAPFSTI